MSKSSPSLPASRLSTVSLYDARPFFEKALVFGVQSGIIDQEKLEAISADAPKGMVQIARYFGSEFLRPEIEKAKDRMVNLVSLYLESTCSGDLQRAAQSLQDHSFLSRSKGGSDMLKSLIAMPTSSHFGMNEFGGFTDAHIPQLAKWTLRSLADYQAELAQRSQVALVIDAALWMADALGMEATELQEAGKDAEAVIRTALLMHTAKRTRMPDWVAFEKTIVALRSKAKVTGQAGGVAPTLAITLPKNLPHEYLTVVQAVQQSIEVDAAKILDPALPVRKLFDKTPAFIGRYFWIEDALSEVDHYDRESSAVWTKATGGHNDDSSLLTLFLCIAAGAPHKTLLTEKAAMALVRKIRKTGLQPELASQYIQAHAPEQHQNDYAQLWADFMHEAQPKLQSDFDYALHDALALLVRDCNVL
jgi:hypothetical protein